MNTMLKSRSNKTHFISAKNVLPFLTGAGWHDLILINIFAVIIKCSLLQTIPKNIQDLCP